MDQEFINELRLAVVQSAENINNLFENFAQETLKKVQEKIIDEARLGKNRCFYQVFTDFTKSARFGSGGEKVEVPLSIFDFKAPEKINVRFAQILTTWAEGNQINISYRLERDHSNRQYLSISLNWSELAKEMTKTVVVDQESGCRNEMKNSTVFDYD